MAKNFDLVKNRDFDQFRNQHGLPSNEPLDNRALGKLNDILKYNRSIYERNQLIIHAPEPTRDAVEVLESGIYELQITSAGSKSPLRDSRVIQGPNIPWPADEANQQNRRELVSQQRFVGYWSTADAPRNRMDAIRILPMHQPFDGKSTWERVMVRDNIMAVWRGTYSYLHNTVFLKLDYNQILRASERIDVSDFEVDFANGLRLYPAFENGVDLYRVDRAGNPSLFMETITASSRYGFTDCEAITDIGKEHYGILTLEIKRDLSPPEWWNRDLEPDSDRYVSVYKWDSYLVSARIDDLRPVVYRYNELRIGTPEARNFPYPVWNQGEFDSSLIVGGNGHYANHIFDISNLPYRNSGPDDAFRDEIVFDLDELGGTASLQIRRGGEVFESVRVRQAVNNGVIAEPANRPRIDFNSDYRQFGPKAGGLVRDFWQRIAYAEPERGTLTLRYLGATTFPSHSIKGRISSLERSEEASAHLLNNMPHSEFCEKITGPENMGAGSIATVKIMNNSVYSDRVVYELDLEESRIMVGDNWLHWAVVDHDQISLSEFCSFATLDNLSKPVPASLTGYDYEFQTLTFPMPNHDIILDLKFKPVVFEVDYKIDENIADHRIIDVPLDMNNVPLDRDDLHQIRIEYDDASYPVDQFVFLSSLGLVHFDSIVDIRENGNDPPLWVYKRDGYPDVRIFSDIIPLSSQHIITFPKLRRHVQPWIKCWAPLIGVVDLLNDPWVGNELIASILHIDGAGEMKFQWMRSIHRAPQNEDGSIPPHPQHANLIVNDPDDPRWPNRWPESWKDRIPNQADNPDEPFEAIKGEVTHRYKVRTEDVGHILKLRITRANRLSFVDSNWSGPVSSVPLNGVLLVEGRPWISQQLSAEVLGLDGIGRIEYRWQWAENNTHWNGIVNTDGSISYPEWNPSHPWARDMGIEVYLKLKSNVPTGEFWEPHDELFYANNHPHADPQNRKFYELDNGGWRWFPNGLAHPIVEEGENGQWEISRSANYHSWGPRQTHERITLGWPLWQFHRNLNNAGQPNQSVKPHKQWPENVPAYAPSDEPIPGNWRFSIDDHYQKAPLPQTSFPVYFPAQPERLGVPPRPASIPAAIDVNDPDETRDQHWVAEQDLSGDPSTWGQNTAGIWNNYYSLSNFHGRYIRVVVTRSLETENTGETHGFAEDEPRDRTVYGWLYSEPTEAVTLIPWEGTVRILGNPWVTHGLLADAQTTNDVYEDRRILYQWRRARVPFNGNGGFPEWPNPDHEDYYDEAQTIRRFRTVEVTDHNWHPMLPDGTPRYPERPNAHNDYQRPLGWEGNWAFAVRHDLTGVIEKMGFVKSDVDGEGQTYWLKRRVEGIRESMLRRAFNPEVRELEPVNEAIIITNPEDREALIPTGGTRPWDDHNPINNEGCASGHFAAAPPQRDLGRLIKVSIRRLIPYNIDHFEESGEIGPVRLVPLPGNATLIGDPWVSRELTLVHTVLEEAHFRWMYSTPNPAPGALEQGYIIPGDEYVNANNQRYYAIPQDRRNSLIWDSFHLNPENAQSDPHGWAKANVRENLRIVARVMKAVSQNGSVVGPNYNWENVDSTPTQPVTLIPWQGSVAIGNQTLQNNTIRAIVNFFPVRNDADVLVTASEKQIFNIPHARNSPAWYDPNHYYFQWFLNGEAVSRQMMHSQGYDGTNEIEFVIPNEDYDAATWANGNIQLAVWRTEEQLLGTETFDGDNLSQGHLFQLPPSPRSETEGGDNVFPIFDPDGFGRPNHPPRRDTRWWSPFERHYILSGTVGPVTRKPLLGMVVLSGNPWVGEQITVNTNVPRYIDSMVEGELGFYGEDGQPIKGRVRRRFFRWMTWHLVNSQGTPIANGNIPPPENIDQNAPNINFANGSLTGAITDYSREMRNPQNSSFSFIVPHNHNEGEHDWRGSAVIICAGMMPKHFDTDKGDQGGINPTPPEWDGNGVRHPAMENMGIPEAIASQFSGYFEIQTAMAMIAVPSIALSQVSIKLVELCENEKPFQPGERQYESVDGKLEQGQRITTNISNIHDPWHLEFRWRGACLENGLETILGSWSKWSELNRATVHVSNFSSVGVQVRRKKHESDVWITANREVTFIRARQSLFSNNIDIENYLHLKYALGPFLEKCPPHSTCVVSLSGDRYEVLNTIEPRNNVYLTIRSNNGDSSLGFPEHPNFATILEVKNGAHVRCEGIRFIGRNGNNNSLIRVHGTKEKHCFKFVMPPGFKPGVNISQRGGLHANDSTLTAIPQNISPDGTSFQWQQRTPQGEWGNIPGSGGTLSLGWNNVGRHIRVRAQRNNIIVYSEKTGLVLEPKPRCSTCNSTGCASLVGGTCQQAERERETCGNCGSSSCSGRHGGSCNA